MHDPEMYLTKERCIMMVSDGIRLADTIMMHREAAWSYMIREANRSWDSDGDIYHPHTGSTCKTGIYRNCASERTKQWKKYKLLLDTVIRWLVTWSQVTDGHLPSITKLVYRLLLLVALFLSGPFCSAAHRRSDKMKCRYLPARRMLVIPKWCRRLFKFKFFLGGALITSKEKVSWCFIPVKEKFFLWFRIEPKVT